MTNQQRVEILKELPRGSMVTIITPKTSRRLNTSGVKMEDHNHGMIVLLDDGKEYFGYRRLTCEKIKHVEEVIARLHNEDRRQDVMRKYPRTPGECYESC